MLAKFADAGHMLWLNLDEREKMMLLYLLGFVCLTVVARISQGSRDRLRREIMEELRDGRDVSTV